MDYTYNNTIAISFLNKKRNSGVQIHFSFQAPDFPTNLMNVLHNLHIFSIENHICQTLGSFNHLKKKFGWPAEKYSLKTSTVLVQETDKFSLPSFP